MLTLLSPHLPAGIEVPAELEQAWTWMEEQGWGLDNDNGYFLVPYASTRVLGPVFCVLEDFVEHWFESGDASSRLVPFASIAGDGSAAALWLDDDRLRFVGLGSEGDAFVLADSAVDFLRLVAVGHAELTPWELGLPPDDEDSVTALAPFRSWVEETFDVLVPGEWPAVGEDEFTDWVARVNGTGEPAAGDRPAPEDSPGAGRLTGTARDLLRLLGEADGAETLRAVAAAVGADVPPHVPDVRWAGAELRAAGIEVSLSRGAIETIFVHVTDGRAQYSRPAELVDGLPSDAGIDDVVAVLGEPERRFPGGLRYVIDGRYLHLGVGEDGIERLTLMRTVP